MTARPRAGAALPAVVVALALLAALAAAGAFTTALRLRAQREIDRTPAAAATAESIAVETLAGWRGAAAATLASGAAVDSTIAAGALLAHLRVTPLSLGRYVVTASVGAPDGGHARAGVWLAARRDSLPLLPRTAVVGTLALSDAAAVVDADAASDGWLGCPPAPSSSGARDSAPSAEMIVALVAHAEVALGDGASVLPAPRTLQRRCDATDTSNWGEPNAVASACLDYRPVIAAAGALTVRGGRGQGVLVVDGDLTLAGDTRFVGLVVARGRVTLSDDARIVGALVLAGDSASVARDRARVERSTCAVARALRAAGAPHPDGPRAWAPLYAPM